ncbi:MAG: SDR family NAD(P)-dependent oxidoreductase [Planctomycetota bacterium]|nr:MAG: SDR family NAD(P)-dependent oxidoreductase [Planctomycetota bacterium]
MSAEHVALVTGGGGGIGAVVCSELGRMGAFVLVAGRDQQGCTRVADEVRAAGGAGAPLLLDVTDPASIATALQDASRLAGPPDWLVNNAGIAVSAPLVARPADSPVDQYETHMDVNFHGARRVFEAVLPAMLERGYGRVVQVASSAALQGYAYVAAYAASKHALLGYSRAAALELQRKGVAVNAVCPHFVDSPMTDESVARIVRETGRTEAAARAFLAEQNPSGELVTTAEVAHAISELLATDMTGSIIELVGGGGRREVEAGWPLGEARG